MFSPDDLRALGEGATPTPPGGTVSLGARRAALRTGDHAALLYWDHAELLEHIVPYLAAGIAAGDKVVYVADDTSVERITDALCDAGIAVPAEIARGHLVITTAHDAFFGGGRFDVERSLAAVRGLADEARAQGFARVRFSVEMTYLLADVPGIEAGREFEARANSEIFACYPFTCICSFNADRAITGDIIADVLATHPILISSGVPLVNPRYHAK